MAETATTPTPETSPAADAVDEITPTLETPLENPPISDDEDEGGEPAGEMSAEEARRILDGGNDTPFSKKRNPLIEEVRDPLADPEEQDVLRANSDEEGAEEQPAAEAEPEPAVEEAPAVEAAEPAIAEEAAQAEGRKRLNINRKDANGNYVLDDRERAILSMVAEEQIPYRTAEKRLFGDRQPEQSAEKTEAAPEVKAPTSAEIAAQLAELKAQRKTALANYENESAADISDKIDDLNRQQIRAELREENAVEQQRAQERTQQQTQAQVEAESIALAAKLYPDADKAGTELNRKVVERLNELEAANDPILRSPRWAFRVAAEVAAEMGIPPAKLSTTPNAKPAEAAAPKVLAKPAAPAAPKTQVPARRAVPVPSPGGVSGPGPSPLQTLSAQIDAASAAGDTKKLTVLMGQVEQLDRERRQKRAA